MSLQELLNSDIRSNLVLEIQQLDLGTCSNMELITLRNLVTDVKKQADSLVIEDELVGYVYSNFDVLNPKMAREEEKRGIQYKKIPTMTKCSRN